MAHLLQPIKIGSLELKNRLVMPPLATSKSDIHGRVTREMIDYYAEKSRGGYISLVIVEHSYIRPEGKASRGQLSVAEDDAVEGLTRVAKTIRQNGSKAVLQINHAGSATTEDVAQSIPVGPSPVMNPRKGSLPRELTGEEIQELIRAFADAARRTQEAGFDGVEIHSAHGFLLNQFLSPLTNKRQDEYGGSILNRIRIHLQVIEAVKDAVQKDFPVLLRIGASDFMPGGTTLEDSVFAAKEFEKAGISAIDISGGFSGYTVPGLKGEGFFAPLSEAVKNGVSIPVILTGGITKVETAESLLEEGRADLIGVGRAILGDSNWAEKAIRSLMRKQ